MDETTTATYTIDAHTENPGQITFSWYDYALFVLMLVLSTLIGVYFGFYKKQSSVSEYLFGGKKMTALPIAISLTSSYVSGVTLLAVPADIYTFGITYSLIVPMLMACLAITYYVYLPVFYRLQVTSIFEYLKMRFDNKVRVFSSFLFTVSVILYLPAVIYIPAIALSQATFLNIHTITPIICAICIFYTTIGGIKAVVWTDTLQCVIIIGSTLTVVFLGVLETGGLVNIWNTCAENGRLSIDFDLDLTKRDTIYTGTLGLLVTLMTFVSVSQGSIQKFLSLSTYKSIRNSIILMWIGMALVFSMSIFTGLIMYARYASCDPLTSRKIQKQNQLLPFYIMEIAHQIPGLSGLFVSGIFSAGLSTLSAVLNSVACTLYKDFVAPFISKDLTEQKISFILKILVITIGIICTALVYVIERFDSLVATVITLNGIAMGPILAVFTGGMLLPIINAKGALWGEIVSVLVMAWLGFTTKVYEAKGLISAPKLPVSIHGCVNSINFTYESNRMPEEEPMVIFKTSFYYYGFMGMMLGIIVAVIVSLFTRNPNEQVPKEYLSPLIHFLTNDRKNVPAQNVELNVISSSTNGKDVQN